MKTTGLFIPLAKLKNAASGGSHRVDLHISLPDLAVYDLTSLIGLLGPAKHVTAMLSTLPISRPSSFALQLDGYGGSVCGLLARRDHD